MGREMVFAKHGKVARRCREPVFNTSAPAFNVVMHKGMAGGIEQEIVNPKGRRST